MSDSQGILARALVAVKFAFTGNAPAVWFGPLQPLEPMAPPEVAGRQYDYPVGFNLNFKPRSDEPIGFEKLKNLARNSDLLRIVMDGQKDKFECLEWSIKPRGDESGKVKPDSSIAAIQAQLEYPDRVHDWAQWSRMLLEQLFVTDAVSIYRRRTRGGGPFSFELLDGATIKVLLDSSGRRPMAPLPAFQQILKGVPAVDYTTDELLYYPQNPRADHAYGFSRVEMIVNVVETSIERMKSQKSYFRDGNLSDGFFEAPDGVQPDQVAQVETRWNNMMLGNVQNKRVAQFLPAGFVYHEIGQPPLQDMFDEWLIRLICFVFSTSPTPFLKQQGLGHGSSKTDHEAAEAAGLANIMGYVRRLMNRILIEDFGRPDLEFSWVEDREFDPDVKSQIEDRRLKNGSLTIDEVRDRNGDDPLPDGLGAKPIIYTTGAATLDSIVNPPEPAPAPVDPNAAPTKPGKQPEDDKPSLTKADAPEKRLTTILADFLATKGEEIGAALGDKLGLAKMDPPSDGYEGRINSAFDEIDWDWTPLIQEVEPVLAGVAVAAGKNATSDLGLFDKDVLAKMTASASDYAQARAAEMVGRKIVDGDLVDNPGWSIPTATRDMIRTAVTQAMESGASNDELAKAVRESAGFSKSRAENIARYETAKAEVQGKIAGWQASDLVGGKEFLAAPGCCDVCQSQAGDIVPLDQQHPHGDAPVHGRCRCDEVAVLKDEMPKKG